MAEVEISYEYIGEAMRSEDVRKQLQVLADKVQRRAESTARSERVRGTFWTEADIRPEGRPRVNVYCDNVEQEWGSSKTARRRLLGRAAEEVT